MNGRGAPRRPGAFALQVDELIGVRFFLRLAGRATHRAGFAHRTEETEETDEGSDEPRGPQKVPPSPSPVPTGMMLTVASSGFFSFDR